MPILILINTHRFYLLFPIQHSFKDSLPLSFSLIHSFLTLSSFHQFTESSPFFLLCFHAPKHLKHPALSLYRLPQKVPLGDSTLPSTSTTSSLTSEVEGLKAVLWESVSAEELKELFYCFRCLKKKMNLGGISFSPIMPNSWKSTVFKRKKMKEHLQSLLSIPGQAAALYL